jgi:hypothetical protein
MEVNTTAPTRLPWVQAPVLRLGSHPQRFRYSAQSCPSFLANSSRAAYGAFVRLLQPNDKGSNRLLSNLFDAHKVSGHVEESRIERCC